MYHIRLSKGMSYSGAVSATRQNPDVFTEDEEKYASAMKSGYFEDLTCTGNVVNTVKEEPGEKVSGIADLMASQEEDVFSGMTVEELKSYAEMNGIGLGGTKKKSDILDMIREAETKAADARNILRGGQ